MLLFTSALIASMLALSICATEDVQTTAWEVAPHLTTHLHSTWPANCARLDRDDL